MADQPNGRDLVALLKHPDVSIREEARELLIISGAEGAAALKKALHRNDLRLSLAAAQILAEFGDPWRLEAMLVALKSPHLLVGDLAAHVLQGYGDLVVDALLSALPDCDPWVQVRVVCVLAQIGSGKAVRPLMGLLRTTDYSTLRYTIITALATIGDPAAIDLIHFFADDPDQHVRRRVHRALKSFEGKVT